MSGIAFFSLWFSRHGLYMAAMKNLFYNIFRLNDPLTAQK